MTTACVTAFAAILLLAGFLLFGLAWFASSQLMCPARRRPASSPTDYGLDAEDVSFPSRDGLGLRGWFIRAEQPKGTVVICHGYAGDASPDLRYAPRLRRAGFNSLLFDFRGHGRSEGQWTSVVYYERLDLLGAIDYLQSRGIDRVGLLGFSMGGAIALSTAPLSPNVVGVAADCGFAELKDIVANAGHVRGIPGWLAPLVGWLTIAVASLRLRANLFSADPVRAVGQIAPHPILIMQAGEDRSVPPTNAERLYAAAGQSKELWLVPKAAHRRIEDVAPEEYSRRVVQFFDRVFGDP